MSTKMYNLYRVEEEDIYFLFGWLLDLRKQYHQHIRETMKPFVARKGIDTVVDLIEKGTRSGLNGLFNIEASAVVYLFEGKLYVHFFGLPSRFQDRIVDNAPFLIDFHYQDQVTVDEPVPDEWKERERVVESILDIDPGARASCCGLSFKFADVNDVFSIMYDTESNQEE